MNTILRWVTLAGVTITTAAGESAGPITQQASLYVPVSSEFSFGSAVAICGDTLVVGSDQESSTPVAAGGQSGDEGELMAGAAYVFVRDGGKWSQQARLEASNAGYKTHFGTSVAIAGETLIVGAIGDGSAAGGVNGDPTDKNVADAGAAYIFVREGTKWSQKAYLKAPQPREFDRRNGPVGRRRGGRERSRSGSSATGRRTGTRWQSRGNLWPSSWRDWTWARIAVATKNGLPPFRRWWRR